ANRRAVCPAERKVRPVRRSLRTERRKRAGCPPPYAPVCSDYVVVALVPQPCPSASRAGKSGPPKSDEGDYETDAEQDDSPSQIVIFLLECRRQFKDLLGELMIQIGR